MRSSTDERLETAYEECHFADGNSGRVWKRVEARMKSKRSALRWAVPLAAAATVLLTLGAVPEGRAAVKSIIDSALNVLGYLSMDPSARPTNTAVDNLVQSGVGSGNAVVTVQPDADWIKDIRFTIDNVLYDGQFVYISYTVDGSSVNDFGPSERPSKGHDVKYKFFTPEDNLHLDNGIELQPAFDSGSQPKAVGGLWHAVNKFDAAGVPLSGTVSGNFSIIFYSTVATANGYEHGADLGSAQLHFMFDANVGVNSCRIIDLSKIKHLLSGDVIITNQIWKDTISFENKKVSLDGCYLVVNGLTARPTGIDFKICFIPSDKLSWLSSQTLFSSLDAKLLSDGTEVGRVTGVEPYGVNGAAIDCSISMEYANIKNLTVIVSMYHQEKLKDIPLELDKPVVIPLVNGDDMGDAAPSGGDPIPGGTFDIDLSD